MERRVINPWTWQEQAGYEQAHEVTGAERILYLSGQVSIDPSGEVVHVGDMRSQLDLVITNIETVLAEADMAVADITRLHIFTTDMDEFFAHADVLDRLRNQGCRYSSTLVGVTRLALPGLMVEIEATAVA